MTFLPLFCSLVSVIWGVRHHQTIGLWVHPLAILVPFLVFAIGVSHGIQQINYISGRGPARRGFRHCCPAQFYRIAASGMMASITALVSFATLTLCVIPMIQELAIIATMGVAYKVISNLVMLPVVASYFKFDPAYIDRSERRRPWWVAP